MAVEMKPKKLSVFDRVDHFDEAVKTDAPILWDYAQRELIIALRSKAYPHQESQARVLAAYHQYVVEQVAGEQYGEWRWQNVDGDVQDFLSCLSSFSLPPLRGGTRNEKFSDRLTRAWVAYVTILEHLKTQVKPWSQYHNPKVTRKRHIEAALQAILPAVPAPKLAAWSTLQQLSEIALHAAVWKNHLRPAALKRHKGKIPDKIYAALEEKSRRYSSDNDDPWKRPLLQKLEALYDIMKLSPTGISESSFFAVLARTEFWVQIDRKSRSVRKSTSSR